MKMVVNVDAKWCFHILHVDAKWYFHILQMNITALQYFLGFLGCSSRCKVVYSHFGRFWVALEATFPRNLDSNIQMPVILHEIQCSYRWKVVFWHFTSRCKVVISHFANELSQLCNISWAFYWMEGVGVGFVKKSSVILHVIYESHCQPLRFKTK